ncbi:glycosyltransferase [Vacuolonema iberomarrocanum]|uniref:glycosyltransferase n=1 Tax=Vacuolonema iberomarrocanum TaxID=3454632 RepID=UPI0019DE8108|nr:glycosyltransferase [filamentous cyanobacterium LEGE 07170]
MNILHINQADKTGGAAIGVYRLHQSLLQQSVESRLMADIVSADDEQITQIPKRRFIDWQIGKITRGLGFNELHLTSTFAISSHPFYQTAEVLHFHNLHNGYFNYLALPKLTREKPAVLTLHDMWGMTGHCAYSFACDRWKTGCGSCPDLATDPAIRRDSTALQWKLKHWAYHHANLAAVVSTSRWMVAQLEQSLLGHLPIYRIPYGLDAQQYVPLDPMTCRATLNISTYRYVLLCAAQSMNNPRKGGDLLVRVLNGLPPSLRKETVLLVFGKGGQTITNAVEIATVDLGYVQADAEKAIAYSAADLFLFPTRADAFGLVAQEAMACGTPTVAFDAGGVSDIVRPGITGLLAEPENVEQFRDAIAQLLEDKLMREKMGDQGRQIIKTEYSLDRYAQSYIALYKKALQIS